MPSTAKAQIEKHIHLSTVELHLFKLKYTNKISIKVQQKNNISAVMYKRSKGSGHTNTLPLRGLVKTG